MILAIIIIIKNSRKAKVGEQNNGIKASTSCISQVLVNIFYDPFEAKGHHKPMRIERPKVTTRKGAIVVQTAGLQVRTKTTLNHQAQMSSSFHYSSDERQQFIT